MANKSYSYSEKEKAIVKTLKDNYDEQIADGKTEIDGMTLKELSDVIGEPIVSGNVSALAGVKDKISRAGDREVEETVVIKKKKATYVWKADID